MGLGILGSSQANEVSRWIGGIAQQEFLLYKQQALVFRPMLDLAVFGRPLFFQVEAGCDFYKYTSDDASGASKGVDVQLLVRTAVGARLLDWFVPLAELKAEKLLTVSDSQLYLRLNTGARLELDSITPMAFVSFPIQGALRPIDNPITYHLAIGFRL